MTKSRTRSPSPRRGRAPARTSRSRSRSLSSSRSRSRSYTPSSQSYSRSSYSSYSSRSYSSSRSRSRSYSRSRSRSPRRDRGGRRERSRSVRRDKERSEENKRLFIRTLTQNVTPDHLKEIFGNFGQVTDVDIPSAKIPGRYTISGTTSHRGHGFVEFSTREDAKRALEAMDGGEIDGMTVAAVWAMEKPQRKMSGYDRRRPSSPGRNGYDARQGYDRGYDRRGSFDDRRGGYDRDRRYASRRSPSPYRRRY
ncbi:hypothetical protein BC832DRAFT_545387 [Gaertneriomyces semiglobifer]|nr:hypothetical protein BC832DRAFT_545387 [Gaertneriomyces semiglobifer]